MYFEIRVRITDKIGMMNISECLHRYFYFRYVRMTFQFSHFRFAMFSWSDLISYHVVCFTLSAVLNDIQARMQLRSQPSRLNSTWILHNDLLMGFDEEKSKEKNKKKNWNKSTRQKSLINEDTVITHVNNVQQCSIVHPWQAHTCSHLYHLSGWRAKTVRNYAVEKCVLLPTIAPVRKPVSQLACDMFNYLHGHSALNTGNDRHMGVQLSPGAPLIQL